MGNVGECRKPLTRIQINILQFLKVKLLGCLLKIILIVKIFFLQLWTL